MNDSNEIHNPENDLSVVVIHLLKGVVYRDSDTNIWGALLNLQPQVRDYVALMGLNLVVDEAEAYAFLRSHEPEVEDDGGKQIPRLIVRRQLSFPVSLMLALLRRKLAEFDAQGDEMRLILTISEISELMRLFLPASSNEAKLVDQIEVHANKAVEYGFLRRLKPNVANGELSYEVRRILKAYVDAQWLSEFDRRLEAYRMYLEGEDVEVEGNE